MKIIIDGPPIAKNRHRCACANGHAFSYDPQVKNEMHPIKQKIAKIWNNAFESENKEIQLEASNLTNFESFSVVCTFAFPIPKSLNLAQTNARLWGLIPHNSKPDLDNLEKFYMDCCTGIIWNDDAQVVALNSKKIYAEIPRTVLEIMPIEPVNLHNDQQAVLKVFSPSRLQEFVNDAIALLANTETKIVSLSICHLAHKYADDLKKIKKLSEASYD